jgi:hypothetical protein
LRTISKFRAGLSLHLDTIVDISGREIVALEESWMAYSPQARAKMAYIRRN